MTQFEQLFSHRNKHCPRLVVTFKWDVPCKTRFCMNFCCVYFKTNILRSCKGTVITFRNSVFLSHIFSYIRNICHTWSLFVLYLQNLLQIKILLQFNLLAQESRPAFTVPLSLNLPWVPWDLRPAEPSSASREYLGFLT